MKELAVAGYWAVDAYGGRVDGYWAVDGYRGLVVAVYGASLHFHVFIYPGL